MQGHEPSVDGPSLARRNAVKSCMTQNAMPWGRCCFITSMFEGAECLRQPMAFAYELRNYNELPGSEFYLLASFKPVQLH